jgi:heat shock protein HslJ
VAAPLQLGDNPWQATAIAGEYGELTPVIEDTSAFIAFEDGQATGDGSCNRFFGPYETSSGGHLEFGDLGTTMMACLDAIMEQERAFLDALISVDTYSIAGSTLEMRSLGDVVLLFEATPTALANTSWRLTGIDNGKQAVVSVAADTEITATFTEDGTLAGSSGCNTYRATWATDGDSIDIGPPMGTKKMCEGEGVMEQEARYLELLGVVKRYRLDAGGLEMLDDAGARQLTFTRTGE